MTIYDELLHERQRYNAPDTTPEDTMGLPIIDAIETEVRNAGHEVSDVLHNILAKHLTFANVAAHVAQAAATVEASPVVRALETAALGPTGEAFAAQMIGDLAEFLTPAAAPAPQPVPLPEPAPA